MRGMGDPTKAVVAVVFFVSAAYTITTIFRAWAMKSESPRRALESDGSASDERLKRLERAVDAIAVEVERISEGQRFTTKLLSEQARRANQPVLDLPSHTPT
jgi:hypothetical protein